MLIRTNTVLSDFNTYLTRTCSEESNNEMIALQKKSSDIHSKVDSHLENVQTQIQQITNESDARSYKSEHFNENVSVRTSSTKASSVVARKHGKVEAEKAKTVSAQQEAALKKQHAQLEEQQLITQAAKSRPRN